MLSHSKQSPAFHIYYAFIRFYPYAKEEGLLTSTIFSIDFLALSGILNGSNASKKTDGLFTLISHDISKVLSRPAIVVLMSRFGLFDSYSFTLLVIKETNYAT